MGAIMYVPPSRNERKKDANKSKRATSLILIAFGVVFSVRERTAVRIQRSRIRMQRPPQLETGFAELEVETPAPPYGPPAPPYSPPLVVTKIGTGYFGSRREV